MLKTLAVAWLLAGGLVIRGQEAKSNVVPLVPPAEQSAHFAAVNRHLDLGGTLYGYVDVDGDPAALGRGLTELFGTIPAVAPQVLLLRQDYAQIFADLGFTDIKAIGFSSVKAGEGFRNRAFFYVPGGRHGLLAGLGGAPTAFADLKYAPEDTDRFADIDVDFPAAYAAIKTVVARVGGATAVNSLEAMLQKPVHTGGISPMEVIEKLAGRVTVLTRLNPANPPFVLPGIVGVSEPGMDFFVRIEGLGPVLGALCAHSSKFVRTDEEGMVGYERAEPTKLGAFHIVAAVQGSVFYLASSRAFLHECLNVKKSLADNPAFQSTLAELGPEGNGLFYITPRMQAQVRQALLAAAAKPGPLSALLSIQAKLLPALNRPVALVWINEPDGIQLNSYANRSLKPTLAMMSIGNPLTLGLMAAMAIPAFQKVRLASQEKVALNNLRQLSAAADQYMLEHGVNQAGYADLVGPGKLIKELHPAAGENYTGIVIHMADTAVDVRLPSGQVIRLRR